jgi:hypothetical protein
VFISGCLVAAGLFGLLCLYKGLSALQSGVFTTSTRASLFSRENGTERITREDRPVWFYLHVGFSFVIGIGFIVGALGIFR